MSLCEGFSSGFVWEKEFGGMNDVGAVVTPELIRGLPLIRVLIVEVAVDLGGPIAGTDTMETEVCCKEDVLLGFGVQKSIGGICPLLI